MRLTVEDADSTFGCVVKLAAGNPGAAVALHELMEKTLRVDPEIGLGPLHYILWIDELDLSAPEIHVFFKDVCKCQVVNMCALLRGKQLGYVKESDILSAVKTARPGPSVPAFDFPELVRTIQKEVPAFAVAA